MKRKNKIILIVSLLNIILIACFLLYSSLTLTGKTRRLLNQLRNHYNNPVPFARFLKDVGLGKEDDNFNKYEIIEEIAIRGPSIIPLLLEYLNKNDSFAFKNDLVLVFCEMNTSDPRVIQALSDIIKYPSADEEIIISSFYTLGYIGPPAESTLLELLQHPNLIIQLRAAHALTNLPDQCQNPDIMRLCLDTLNQSDQNLQSKAINILRSMGMYAQPAVPDLLRAYVQNPELFWDIRYILREIGEPAVPLLLQAVRADRSPKPLPALMALVDLDPNLVAPEFLPDLIETIGYRDPKTLKKTPEAFAKLSPRDRLELYGYEGDPLRLQAIAILTSLGPHAQPAIPGLIQVLEPNDFIYYEQVFRALWAINPSDPCVISFFSDTLHHQNDAFSSIALHSFSYQIWSEYYPPECASILIQAFIDGDLEFRIHSLDALSRIGPSAQKLVPYLIEMLPVSDKINQFFICQALFDIDPEGTLGDVMTVLMDFLHREDVDSAAMLYLSQMKSWAQDAVPDLKAFLDEEEISIRLDAANALAKIDPQHSSDLITDTLLQIIKNKRADIRNRRQSIWTLQLNDLLNPSMIPVIIDILEEDNDYLRESTVNFLSCFPAESHVILPHLKRILKNDEDSSVRIATAGAILKLDPDHPDTDALDYIISIFFGKYPYSWDVPYTYLSDLGPAAAPAVPILIEKLTAPRYPVRQRAADTLAAIGPAAQDAISHLQNLRHDPVPEVRQAAASALKKIQK